MKTFILISALVLSSFGVSQFASANDVKMIKHKVQSHETAWFLAQVFLGHGNHYKDLLAMNDMKSPDELKYGKEIIVMKPKYYPAQKDFSARYDRLLQERSEKLYSHKKTEPVKSAYQYTEAAHREIASEVGSGVKAVEVPSQTVKEQAPKVGLPFTPVKSSVKTPADMAREELEKY